ncbi:SDR family NAD(P)-dependent oxidoreductase [Nocardioides sp. Root151]|uniref:SDR family NAD(P)-dependent oxidoreductase n=1 Tax=Nocardioides sp. Root151 TaxID=1736475 RepID=UPI0007029562|nr:SDR family NAD(P)-dependent oxidoreductase [Nocardioides sp. Root151]KQZ70612.1 3-oxoacyl-ACP reductase [Nocardioides sp. Root151]
MSAGDLQDRVVVVMGAGSSGAGTSNGEAAALAYAESGATVVAVDRNGNEAHRVADRIAAAGGRSLALEADVTVDADVEAVVKETIARFGVPHVVHGNVGVARTGSVMELAPAEWQAAVDVNLNGAYLAFRHALPPMLEEGRGVFVQVSSLASVRHTGYPYPAYSAAKAALNQLTVSIALTYADRGIRANAILPGLIDTPLVGQQLAGSQAEVEARHALSPTGRMGSPWDVANAAVFLASDKAAYINGVCLPVDGGLGMRSV